MFQYKKSKNSIYIQNALEIFQELKKTHEKAENKLYLEAVYRRILMNTQQYHKLIYYLPRFNTVPVFI